MDLGNGQRRVHYVTVAYEYALAIIVNDQTRPACTPAALFAHELLFERLVRLADEPMYSYRMQLLMLNGIAGWNSLRRDLREHTRRVM